MSNAWDATKNAANAAADAAKEAVKAVGEAAENAATKTADVPSLPRQALDRCQLKLYESRTRACLRVGGRRL